MSKSTKKTPTHFYASSYRYRDMTMNNVWPSKSRTRSRSTILTMMANVKIYRYLPHIFAIALTVSEIWQFLIFCSSKSRSRSWSIFLQWHYLMANTKIYKCLSLIFESALTVSLANAKIWKSPFFTSCANDCNTHKDTHKHRHVHTQTQKRTSQ